MSGDFSAVEKSIEEILIDLMAEKVMSTGAQASSTRGVQASPSTARRSGPSRTTTEKQSKHRDDLENEAHPINPARLHPASGWHG
jgi:hypothetical protein